MNERRRVDDPEHVRVQYDTADNLDARARLHVLFGTNERGWMPWVMDRVLAGEHRSILDVGGGPGGLWASQGTRLDGDEMLVCTDLSPAMVAQARARTHGRARYAIANAESVPFKNATFDLVVANHMLYHVPTVDAALAEFARVLIPGGRLIAATNGAEHMQQVGELVNKGSFTISGFSLETGGAILERHFADVSLEVFDEDLLVTEVQPLVDYISSMADIWVGAAPQDEIRAKIERVITDEGAFRIDKRAGIFTAISS